LSDKKPKLDILDYIVFSILMFFFLLFVFGILIYTVLVNVPSKIIEIVNNIRKKYE
jgi:hypothetical protein